MSHEEFDYYSCFYPCAIRAIVPPQPLADAEPPLQIPSLGLVLDQRRAIKQLVEIGARVPPPEPITKEESRRITNNSFYGRVGVAEEFYRANYYRPYKDKHKAA